MRSVGTINAECRTRLAGESSVSGGIFPTDPSRSPASRLLQIDCIYLVHLVAPNPAPSRLKPVPLNSGRAFSGTEAAPLWDRLQPGSL